MYVIVAQYFDLTRESAASNGFANVELAFTEETSRAARLAMPHGSPASAQRRLCLCQPGIMCGVQIGSHHWHPDRAWESV
jgi:hypothetical protein